MLGLDWFMLSIYGQNLLMMHLVKAEQYSHEVDWNVTALISRGSNFFFAALYCSRLGLNALLASPR